MASRYVTLKSSALSSNVKFATLTPQCFKRIHNTSEHIMFNEKVEILNTFMRDLKISGYNECERKAILYGGLKTHQKILEKVKAGLRPYYRPQSFQKESRMSEKLCQKNNWFKKHDSSTQYAAVMFVDATPNDELLKLFRHIENTHKISDQHRIKFVSK